MKIFFFKIFPLLLLLEMNREIRAEVLLPLCSQYSVDSSIDMVSVFKSKLYPTVSFVCKPHYKTNTAAQIYAYNDPDAVFPYGINCRCDDGHYCIQCALTQADQMSGAGKRKVSEYITLSTTAALIFSQICYIF
jgi:hypothetical protein